MTITVYQNHFSVERGCKTFRYDSVDGDRFDCECAFLYLPGLMWTWPKAEAGCIQSVQLYSSHCSTDTDGGFESYYSLFSSEV